MARTNLSEISTPGRIGVAIVGVAQAAFAFLAFWDLWHRPASDVKGPKLVWAPVLLMNWIGPASYFLFGIKR
ncbi:PLDc N-terminal domain-containing protein [uncultured Microbacterium sp.]|uniref:PLDc N-terminal domain-containing protein n=1 Tax=uncultured Microbacterium sp. TaxID=191216 RepID=UPI0035CA2F8D